MNIFEKSKAEVDSAQQKEIKKTTAQKEAKKVTVSQLFQNDMLLLEKMELLQQKMDVMDKNNKKFLMAATLNDGRAEQLEQEIVNMRLGVISLIDQIDILLSAVFASEAEELKKGVESSYTKIVEIASELGVEEINATENTKFDLKEMECEKAVYMEEYDDNTVVELIKKGYKDISTGKILRYAKVIVNKQAEEK